MKYEKPQGDNQMKIVLTFTICLRWCTNIIKERKITTSINLIDLQYISTNITNCNRNKQKQTINSPIAVNRVPETKKICVNYKPIEVYTTKPKTCFFFP